MHMQIKTKNVFELKTLGLPLQQVCFLNLFESLVSIYQLENSDEYLKRQILASYFLLLSEKLITNTLFLKISIF